jgi:hypothetical protein
MLEAHGTWQEVRIVMGGGTGAAQVAAQHERDPSVHGCRNGLVKRVMKACCTGRTALQLRRASPPW